jgi:hypothetical protein
VKAGSSSLASLARRNDNGGVDDGGGLTDLEVIRDVPHMLA